MTPEAITSVINLGAAGAVIIVVVYFLRFIEKRDKDWQAFFTKLLENKETPIAELTLVVHDLLTEFQKHDAWEHTMLSSMQSTIMDKAQPHSHQRRDDIQSEAG